MCVCPEVDWRAVQDVFPAQVSGLECIYPKLCNGSSMTHDSTISERSVECSQGEQAVKQPGTVHENFAPGTCFLRNF